MKIELENIGPARGKVSLGEAKPGLNMIVGENAVGKTSVLRVLAALRDQNLLRSTANITDGETEASLELEPVRVTFRRSGIGAGAQAPKVEGDPPEVTEMPAAIETLITGDHIKGEEARARRRLGALLSYAPVPVDASALDRLCECLWERSFTHSLEDLEAVIARTVEMPPGTRAKASLRTAQELRRALEEEHPADLLAAHDALVKLLHEQARAAEKMAEAAGKEADAYAARAKQAADSANPTIACDHDQLLRLLRQKYELGDLGMIATEADEEVRRIEQEFQAAESQRRRVAKLREAHGPRPEMDGDGAAAAWDALAAEWDALAQAALGNGGEFRWGDLYEPVEALVNAARDVKRAWDPGPIRHQQERWDEVEAEINAPIEGPRDQDVVAARQKAREAEHALEFGRQAVLFQDLEATREGYVTLAGTLTTLGEDYRKAARDSWSYMGAVVTEELKLPWLQVDGLDIYLGYVGGRLNDDPELIAAAEKAAKAAAADELSPVSFRRFLLERIREASSVEWRLLDSETRISTGELHEACLNLMLSHSNGAGVLIVPWSVTAALDEDRLAAFSGRLRDKGLVALGERPRRKGDPEGMSMEVIAETGG